MIGLKEREGPLMKNNPLISRIVAALIIGVLTGCIIVFFFPNDFFVSQSITSNRHLPVAVPKTQVSFSSKINYLSCFSFIFNLCLLLNFKSLHPSKKKFLHVAWFWLSRNLTMSSNYCFCLCHLWYVFDFADFTNCGSLWNSVWSYWI